MHNLGPDDYIEGAINLYLDVRRRTAPPRPMAEEEEESRGRGKLLAACNARHHEQ